MLDAPLLEPLGLSLLHFLWQGGLVGVGLWLLLKVVHKANPRYLSACASLVLLVGLPVMTYSHLQAERPVTQVFGTPVSSNVPDARAQPTATRPARNFSSASAVQPRNAETDFKTYLPYFVLAWLTGVFGVSLNLLGGYLALRRVRTRYVRPVSEQVQAGVLELRRHLKLQQKISVLESSLAQIVFVSGVFKPVILLPTSVLTGLTPKELEFVIAHELAHVKRRDYLVNLLQGVAEALLFYHPVVWWVNRVIRQEREHVCDDVAVRLCGNAKL